MRQSDVDRFFRKLSRNWESSAEVLMVGGAAALLLGGARPTLDIDFEISFVSTKLWTELEKAIGKTEQETGITSQFSESIERWSQVTFLDYKKHRRLYKRFGKVKVYLLEPAYWSIGKISRYWDQDIQDMIVVFRKQKPDPLKLARLWSRALQESPRSTTLFLVKKNAHHFFQTFGPKIWGVSFQLEKVLSIFSLL